MFLSNVRTALIVAINIPLALLFAFAMLYLRGQSANLLSIGAVDFGIIVDSSVIMVENIYRHLAAGERPELAAASSGSSARSARSTAPLLFSTAIMVCAFLPLFTMRGPEGQLFGPMAETYAFALAGGLLLAVLLSPVLCMLLLRNLKPAEDNFLVRWLKTELPPAGPLVCLKYRWTSMAVMAGLMAVTALPDAGRGPGVHARTGRGQSLDPRRDGRQHRPARDVGQGGPRGAGHHAALSRGGDDRLADSAGPTTAPTPPASTTWSSSCR